LFSESCYIKSFLELSFAKGKLEVDIGIDRSSFVFRSVHVISLYQFIQIVDVKVFMKFWSMNRPPAPLSMRVSRVCLLEPIFMGTEIEFLEILAIVTE
jgi:hypothetical protein